MNIDLHELQQVAQAAPRVDMYAGIHKALRALMADTLLHLGRADCDDAQELEEAVQRLLQLLELCRGHLHHENEFIHRAMEARAPGASGQIAHEHAQHEEQIAALAAQARALSYAAVPARAAEVLALYRALSLFVAHNFEHMHVEETANNAVLWARYTDAELIEIHDALVASIPPEEMMFILRWLVPYLNPAERLALMADMRAHAPAPAFAAAIETVRPHLNERDWAKLAAGLRLPGECARG